MPRSGGPCGNSTQVLRRALPLNDSYVGSGGTGGRSPWRFHLCTEASFILHQQYSLSTNVLPSSVPTGAQQMPPERRWEAW